MDNEQAPALDSLQVACSLFESIPMAAGIAAEDWTKLWPRVSAALHDYLTALEAHCGARGLAKRATRHLEKLILEQTAALEFPLTIGSTRGVRIDLNQPVADVALPRGIEQLVCAVELAGRDVGKLALHPIDGLVLGRTIAQAIETKLARALMLSYLRLKLPAGSRLKIDLATARREKEPSQLISRFAVLIWPILQWQWREGILREPRLLLRLLRLGVTRAFGVIWQLVRTKAHCRRGRLRDLVRSIAQRFVREEAMVRCNH